MVEYKEVFKTQARYPAQKYSRFKSNGLISLKRACLNSQDSRDRNLQPTYQVLHNGSALFSPYGVAPRRIPIGLAKVRH
jgi:hypothetical protein